MSSSDDVLRFRDEGSTKAAKVAFVCVAVVMVPTALLVPGLSGQVRFVTVLIAGLLLMTVWWVGGWRSELKVRRDGIWFNDPFRRSQFFPWSEVEGTFVARDPVGQSCVVVRARGKDWFVSATNLDSIESRSPDKVEWLDGIVKAIEQRKQESESAST
jgi:hypothetical protein